MIKIIKVNAHCDLPCGTYTTIVARFAADALKAIMEKYNNSTDTIFKTRAIIIKEEQANVIRKELSILWHDYFTQEHFKTYEELQPLLHSTIRLAGGNGAKKGNNIEIAEEILNNIDKINEIFVKTKNE